MRISKMLPIQDPSQVGEARRAIVLLATDLELSETLIGQISIVVTELAGNIIKHAKGEGMLVFRPLSKGTNRGVEVLALDRGLGMADVSRCMEDGYSTAGSSGTGLGAIRRLSSRFDIYSLRDQGTGILTQFWQDADAASETSALEYGVVCLPVKGEEVCGDSWAVHDEPGFESLMVADGLGHGPLACEASDTAVELFAKRRELSAVEMIKAAHLALKSTRGAAVSVAKFDPSSSTLHFSGVGNVTGVIFSRNGSQRRMVSHNGTAGIQTARVQEFSYPYDSDSLVVLHSDGLTTHWGLEKYPGMILCHPSLIAGILYRDYERSRDDVTVLVARMTAGGVS